MTPRSERERTGVYAAYENPPDISRIFYRKDRVAQVTSVTLSYSDFPTRGHKVGGCLSLAEGVESLEECGVRDGGRLGSANNRLSIRSQRRDCEGHGDTVIVEGIELRT